MCSLENVKLQQIPNALYYCELASRWQNEKFFQKKAHCVMF